MLSPVGVCEKPDGFDFKENIKKSNGRGPPKFFRKLAISAWENKWSPFGFVRKSGSIGGRKLINMYLNRRIGESLTEEERELLGNYM